MSPAREADVWASGDAYEPYIGRWSRMIAHEFLAWLAAPPGRRWVDVGCGTGALTAAVLALTDPETMVGVDPSAAYVEHARATIDDDRASFLVAGAEALPFADGTVDVAVAGLVLNFVPDPAVGLSEMARVTRPGGGVASYVWDYADGMEMIRRFWDAAVELDASVAALHEGVRFPLCKPEPLERLFSEAGLEDVAVRSIDVQTVFRDFDDYWSPFLGGQGPAPAYATSLSKERRAFLRDRIRSDLPIAADGSISLTARAWGARGTK